MGSLGGGDLRRWNLWESRGGKLVPVIGLIMGDVGQLIAQLINMATVIAWALVTGFVLFGILKATMGLRVTQEEELQGLDIPEHGMEAYPMEAAIH